MKFITINFVIDNFFCIISNNIISWIKIISNRKANRFCKHDFESNQNEDFLLKFLISSHMASRYFQIILFYLIYALNSSLSFIRGITIFDALNLLYSRC